MQELKGYYRQIRSWLPCGGKIKRTLMSSITATIDGYISENPGIDFATLQAHFGTLQQIAAAFVDEMGTDELLKALRARRRIVKIILGSAAAIVAIWAVAVFSLWVMGIIVTFGYSVMGPPVVIE